MFKSKLTFFRWLVFGVIGLLALWMICGNLLASYLEKEIDREIAQKVKQLEEEYPDPEPNDSGLKLEAILSKEFGITITGMGKSRLQNVSKFEDYIGYHPDFKESTYEFEKIRASLNRYIKSQISKPNDEIEPAPKELQDYLESKTDALKKVQNHILNSELPKLKTGIKIFLLAEGNFFNSLSINDYNLVDFQKIAALDILEKQRQGKNQEARKMLEVFWRTSQFFKNDSTLHSHIIALLIERLQLGVIRKVDNLSPKWQKRLLEHDYRLSILQITQGEDLGVYKYSSITSRLNNRMTLSNLFIRKNRLQNFLLDFLINSPLSKPYLRLSAVNYYRTMAQELEQFPIRNVCSIEEKVTTHLAWWNLPGKMTWVDWTIEQLIAAEKMLQLEITQKIMQVKELAKQQGKWPDSFPNLDSKFCPDRQYVYQVSEDGTMTISLDKQPEWVKEDAIWVQWKDVEIALPLTYSDRTPPR